MEWRERGAGGMELDVDEDEDEDHDEGKRGWGGVSGMMR
jgi:hypothetical protein